MNISIIKQVPPESVGGKILFVGTDGKFYNAKGKHIKHTFSPAMQHHKGGSAYPKMRQYLNRLCHHLVWETFVGPRHKGYEIDHINGDKMNWSLDNLEEVTKEENDRRGLYLRLLRAKGFNPKDYQPENIKAFFILRRGYTKDEFLALDREEIANMLKKSVNKNAWREP